MSTFASVVTIVVTLLTESPGPCPVLDCTWGPENAPQGANAPAVVPFRDDHALRFVRSQQTRVNLGQGSERQLRVEGPLTLAAVVQLDAEPPTKVSLVSKWRLAPTGRSYELGLTPTRQLFFTISASGSWPQDARELLSTRPLAVGVPYHVAAVYEPGKRMAVFVNGVPSGELTDGVPGSIFDSDTPVLLGNRHGNEADCAFEGRIGAVSIFDRAVPAETLAADSKQAGLDRPPEPELPNLKPPYDLDRVKEETQTWYRRLQAPNVQYGAYRLTQSSPPDLYASADVAWIRWTMDDLELSDRQRSEWIDVIQDQQNPDDGSYRHITGHCKTHAFCHATGALNMLGGKHRYRPRLLEPYSNVERIPAWLDGIDWVRQWSASHDIWGAGVPLVSTPSTPEAWKKALFAWLDAEVDPATGFWRKGVEARSPLEYLGGAFHVWPVYAAADRPLPYPQRVIDSVLKLQRGDGSFDGHFGYGNMDGVWVLQYLSDRTEYRRHEVEAALERNLRGLMHLHNTAPHRFFADAHGTESRIATLAILQAALPGQLRAKRPWRSAWHQPQLFQLRYDRQ